jgi:DNA polymerase
MDNNILNSLEKILECEKLAGINDFYTRDKIKTGEDKMTLSQLKKEVLACEKCALCRTRKNVIFGEGNLQADLMFVGEAPGRDEDIKGRPFVGKAGRLLTKIIEAIGLTREDVFIGNVLKCRPPDNRNPLPEEIMKCSPYLIEQIKLIQPKVICALGKFAAQTLLNTEKPISRLRGTFYDYHGVKLMPTYHPAYLLRNAHGKKDVWEDMKLIAKELGLEIPDKNREK